MVGVIVSMIITINSQITTLQSRINSIAWSILIKCHARSLETIKILGKCGFWEELQEWMTFSKADKGIKTF